MPLAAPVLDQLDVDSLPGTRSIAISSPVASGTPTIPSDLRLLVETAPEQLEADHAAVELERAVEV